MENRDGGFWKPLAVPADKSDGEDDDLFSVVSATPLERQLSRMQMPSVASSGNSSVLSSAEEEQGGDASGHDDAAGDAALRGSLTSNNTFSYIGAIDVNEEMLRFRDSPEKIDEGAAEDEGSPPSPGTEVVEVVAAADRTPQRGGGNGGGGKHQPPLPLKTTRQSLVDIPLSGPPTPAMTDLTQFLDQAVYSLESLAERSQSGGSGRPSSLSSSMGSALGKDWTLPPPSVAGNSSGNGARSNDSDNEDQRSQASATPSLPSYGFNPSVAEKSSKIIRPAGGQVSSNKFRGASLLAWRRGRRAPASKAAESHMRQSGLSSVGEGENEDKSRTDALSDEEEGGPNDDRNNATSVGSLLKDTYSFIYVYSACPPSAPFLYALFLFLFQSLVYGLLLSSLIDVHHPHNPLHVPASVSMEMRIAQGCAILIAVFNSVDIMVAMNNLLRAPDAIVVMNGDQRTELSSLSHNVDGSHALAGAPRADAPGGSLPAGPRFRFANFLRLIEGCLAVTASFILIVRSDDIIDMFINFAALEFVVNLDNLAFALAEHGLISNRLQDAARFVGGLGFSYNDHLEDGNHRRTKKDKPRGGGSCTSSSRRLAMLKGSYLSRLFGWPVRLMTRRPDATRRTTLFIMTLSLFGCWGFILSGLNNGDFLCKSLDVEFFHAHVRPASEAEAESGIKPFLSSRSGTYVAAFTERDVSILDTVSDLFLGRSKLFLAYRKADVEIETTEQESDIAPGVPKEYAEVIFFNPDIERWVFTTCDPETDLSSEDRVCAGPEVHSVQTTTKDLIKLSSSPFYIGNEDLDASSMALPASVTCNECGLLESSELKAVESNVRTCGLTGGECSAPQEKLGFSRQCLCPPGQYGLFCADHYSTSCPVLEIIHDEGAEEPTGAAQFEDLKPFTLLDNQRGGSNTPVWQRRTRGYIDRMEWHGGTHWTITQRYASDKVVRMIAIADGSSPEAGGAWSPSGGPANGLVALQIQPPPAGLAFHAPRATAWGTLPDYTRPFYSYAFRCKVPSLG